MISVLYIFSDWAILILRVVISGIFLAHGWPKLKDLKTTINNFGMMGFKPGWFWGTFIAFLETVGASLLLLGVEVQLWGLLFAFEMLVAALWKKKKGQGLVNGYELDLLLLAACLVLATVGGGY